MRIDFRKLFYPNTEYYSQVNIVPVIAKADTINKPELAKFKSKVMQELTNNGVQIYQFPTDDETIRFVTKKLSPIMNRPAFFHKASFPGRQYLSFSLLEANPTTFFFQILITLLAGRLKSRLT